MTEPAQTQKQTSVEAHSKPKTTAPKSARLRVCSWSRSRSRSGQSKRQPWALYSDTEVASDDSTGSTSHPGLIPITVKGVKYFGAYHHWCVSDHDVTAIVPKSETRPRPEVTDTRYATSRRCGWQPCPYVRL